MEKEVKTVFLQEVHGMNPKSIQNIHRLQWKGPINQQQKLPPPHSVFWVMDAFGTQIASLSSSSVVRLFWYRKSVDAHLKKQSHRWRSE